MNVSVSVLSFVIVSDRFVWSSMGYDFIEFSTVISVVSLFVWSSVIFQMFRPVSSFAIPYSILFNFI